VRASVSLTVLGVAVWLVPVSPVRAQPAAAPSGYDFLYGVSAESPSSAWVVGQSGFSWAQTLTEHWNGASWTITRSPDPGGPDANNYLYGVAATSPSRAWAVGAYRKGDRWHTLILRWTSTSWKQAPAPDPGHPSSGKHFPKTVLNAVSAVSGSNVWAVGKFNNGRTEQTLIVHWNGRSWRQVASPDVGGHGNSNSLWGVAAVSRSNVWAVGSYRTAGQFRHTLIVHWNGRSWRRVASPNPPTPGPPGWALAGVGAAGSSCAWAVGWGSGPLIEHWNGTAWKHVANRKGVPLGGLQAVAASSCRDAWAVGWPGNGPSSLIEHWNGTSWRPVVTQQVGLNFLYGVAATSARNAWAVGTYYSSTYLTLIEHWDGTAWTQMASPNR
jgi:hypothetical protein